MALEEEHENKKRIDELKRKDAENTNIIQKYYAQPEDKASLEIGYFSELMVSFKSTEDDIKKNYLNKAQEILKDAENPEFISYNKDRYIIKELLQKVRAFKLLTGEKERVKYLNRIRLRSIASQYLSIMPAINDGNFFPYMMFSILTLNGTESRMIELNFVEEVLHDRLKDHCTRSQNFSEILRVNKGFERDLFHIEFNNEKITYRTQIPHQRDFLVAMVRTAMEEVQINQSANKGVNCPDNPNLIRDAQHLKSFQRTKNSFNLQCIENDYVLPGKSVKIGKCRK